MILKGSLNDQKAIKKEKKIWIIEGQCTKTPLYLCFTYLTIVYYIYNSKF